jgi:hypothetical protein
LMQLKAMFGVPTESSILHSGISDTTN